MLRLWKFVDSIWNYCIHEIILIIFVNLLIFIGLIFLFIYLVLNCWAHDDLIFISAGVHDFIPDYQPSPMTDSGLSSSSTSSSISLGNTSAAMSHMHTTILNEVDISVEQDEKVKTLIEFITSR